jgi:hypothetical protein
VRGPRRDKNIDRRVCHSLLNELHVDDAFSMLHEHSLHGDRKVVHEGRDEIGFPRQGHMNVLERGLRDGSLCASGEVPADRAE